MFAAPAAREPQAIGDVGAAQFVGVAAVDVEQIEIELGAMRRQPAAVPRANRRG